jgi:hypothetical protein
MADETDHDDSGSDQPDNAAGDADPATRPPPAAGDGGGGQKDGPPPADDQGPAPIPNEDADVLVTGQIRDEVKDALELADFIIKTGVRKPDGRSVPPELIRIIKVAAGKIRFFEDPKSLKDPVYIKASDWARFELAYYSLVEFTSPVTVETLRNTRGTGEGLADASLAQQFTRSLWYITLLFAVIVIACAAVATGADNNTPKAWAKGLVAINFYTPIIVPWAYGGLGACAYLLRTAHSLIAERAFDMRRKPEYMNRILLGMVSGGAIVLLFDTGSDDALKISAAALGFVAGYSSDLLFNAVERVTAAILPKVGLDTLKKDAVPAHPPLELATGGLTLKDLMDRMESAKPEDKEMYKSLLAKLRDRL